MNYLKNAIILVAALVVAFLGWKVYQRINRDYTNWKAEVVEKEMEIERLKAAADEQVADFLEREEVWKQRRIQDSTTIAALTVEVDKTTAAADSLGQELRVKLPIKFRAQFDQLIAAHNAQVQAILAREARKDSRVAYLESELEQTAMDFHEINRTLRAALAESQELTEFWEGKAKRQLWEKPLFVAPVTAGLTLGAVALFGNAVN